MTYAEFLAAKARKPAASGLAPGPVHPSLFGFQRAIVDWAVRLGRAAVFADCGMGKTRIQVEWIRQMGKRGLIVCPLSVAEQTIDEARAIGVAVTYAPDAAACVGDGIWITNYQRLPRFRGVPFDAIALDESSILKSLDGKTRTMLLREFTAIPYRLCCTATPAPNDIAEMANHAQFLGVMDRVEMLATFFVHGSSARKARVQGRATDARSLGEWRLKGHAEDAFWAWLATWAVYIRKPSDLGFDDDGFNLPPLHIESVEVRTTVRAEGELFAGLAGGIGERAKVRKATAVDRIGAAVALIESRPGPWVVWCGLNTEASAMSAALNGQSVNIEGADLDDERETKYRAWRSGSRRVLVSKPAIYGHGMNWQHVSNVLFLGLGDSYEAYYQAIRRCWRFGQQSPVHVYIVTSDAEGSIVDNVKRKEADAERMAAGIIDAVRSKEIAAVRGAEDKRDVYREEERSGDGWRLLLGDSCTRLAEIEPGSVGLSVFSPPFASLFTYSASDHDLGNSKDYDLFFRHLRFVTTGLLRATKPCRRACVHVQQVSTTKATHGQIGWRDFRADTVRLFVECGWIYDGEVVIDKDPQAQAIRTKSKALMFVQKDKDSAWSRPAMADYILLFRSPGESTEPVKTDVNNEEWILWARPIWYGIRESNTLNAACAREDKDEKHICPLQLETIERCIRLWSNTGDLVMDPFAGIGSTGYMAVRLGRRSVGIELKPSYYATAIKNMEAAESEAASGTLFSLATTEDPAC